MSCPSAPDAAPARVRQGGRRSRASRAFTLIEALVAVAIVMIFVTGAVTAFLQMMRANDRAQARLDALANARHALDAMSTELKRARLQPLDAGPTSGTVAASYFYGTQSSRFVGGNNLDDDRDGRTDEEFLDGRDNDADWTIADDRHASITSGGIEYRERPRYLGAPDLGDERIDEDNNYTSATMIFETFPLPRRLPKRIVSFSMAPDPDAPASGRLALMMESREFDPVTSESAASVGPVAVNVLSFTALYYDARQVKTPTVPISSAWEGTWDSSSSTLGDPNTYPRVPPSVYLSITIAPTPASASPTPIPTDEAVTLDTVVDVESVIRDPRYDTNLRVTF